MGKWKQTKLDSTYPNNVKLRINVYSYVGATLRILNICLRLFLKRFFQRMQMASCKTRFTANWHGDVQTPVRDSNCSKEINKKKQNKGKSKKKNKIVKK